MDFSDDLKNNNIILIIQSKENYHNDQIGILKTLEPLVKKVCYVCINEPYNSVISNLKKNNLPQEKFFFIDTLTRNVQEPPAVNNCIFVSAPNALTEISLSFSKALNEQKCDAALFDTISALLVYENTHSIIQFTHNIITKLRVSSGKAIFIALKDDLNSELVKDLYMFVDKVIDLTRQ